MPFTPKLVPPSEPPRKERVRQRIKAAGKPPTELQCRCGCRELLVVRIGVQFKNGRASGGTVQWLCASCFMRGERVVIA